MKNRFLYDYEMELVNLAVEYAVPGPQRLIDLFEELWELVLDKTGFGRRYKRSVEAGLIPGVALATKTVMNHQIYIVRPVH